MIDIDWTDFTAALNDVSSMTGDDLVEVVQDEWPRFLQSPLKFPPQGQSADEASTVGEVGTFIGAPTMIPCSDSESDASLDIDAPKARQQEETPGKSQESRAKKVSFSTIEVREYNITIGDHPNCRDGLPLTIDWKFARRKPKLVAQVHPAIESYFVFDRPSHKEPERMNFCQKVHRLQCVTGMSEKQILHINTLNTWGRQQAATTRGDEDDNCHIGTIREL